jgi:hypothetical protein
MSRDVGNVGEPTTVVLNDIHQITTYFAAGPRATVKFERIRNRVDFGYQASVDSTRKTHFGQGAVIASALRAEKVNE